MPSLLLTPEEAERFASWLENEAMSAAGMIEQFTKIGGPAVATLAQSEKRYAAACIIIARRIRSTERMEIGPNNAAEGG